METWFIHSQAWGRLTADEVHTSSSFGEHVITAWGVKRDGKDMWEKAYLPLHDITVIIPPGGVA